MSKTDTTIACLLALIVAAILLPFASIGVDPHHDGIMLKPALDVLSGQVLFRDTFMQYGALTCYLEVLALWLLPSLLALKYLVVAVYGITLFFLYGVWRLMLPRSLTLLACGLFVLFIPYYESQWTMVPWSSEFALMFQAVALFALGQVLRGKEPVAWALMLGLTTACVFWCRQPVGILMVGALLVIGVVLKLTGWTWPAAVAPRATLKAFATGFILVNGLLLGGIVLSGSFPAWWYQNFIWPKQWAIQGGSYEWNAHAPIFLHPANGLMLLALLFGLAAPGLINRIKPVFSRKHLVIYYLILAGLLALKHDVIRPLLLWPEGGWSVVIPFALILQTSVLIGWFSLRKAARPAEDYRLIAFSGIALAALVQYYPVPCARHIFWSLAPAFGLFVHLVWRWTGWRPLVVFIVLGGAFAPMISTKITAAREKLTQPLTTLSVPSVLRGMRVSPQEASEYEQIDATLRPLVARAPQTPSAMIGYDALFLCFTPERRNPSPYFVTWGGLLSAEQSKARWEQIFKTRPILFIQTPRNSKLERSYENEGYVPLLKISGTYLLIAAPAELVTAVSQGKAPGIAPK